MAHGITATDSMFSVREMPWHGLGAVLDEYPESIADALQKAGLEWGVTQGDVLVVAAPEWTDDFDKVHPAEIVPARGYRANIRQDTGDVLGIVSDDYKVVENREAFKFMDSLIGSDLHFETAGSLHGGRKVWVLSRLPEFVEVGGDQVGNYLYVANSHDGSMAVTAAITPVRIVCANTLGAALHRSESGVNAQRTYKFRHTGDLQAKFDEARNVMGISINYAEQFKVLGDRMAQEPLSVNRFDRKVVKPLVGLDKPDELGKRALTIREGNREALVNLFEGKSPTGDTTGNSPGTRWTAWNAVGEYADHFRRVTSRTDQMARSFEDTSLKDRGLALVREA